MPDPKKFSEPRSSKEKVFFGLLGGPGPCSPGKSIKIKGQRLAKNAFPEISARSLALKLGVLKNCLLAWAGGGGGKGNCPPASHCPG